MLFSPSVLLSPRPSECSGELLPGPSPNHPSCSSPFRIALTARGPQIFSITLSQSGYIYFKNEHLSARKIWRSFLHCHFPECGVCDYTRLNTTFTTAQFTVLACTSVNFHQHSCFYRHQALLRQIFQHSYALMKVMCANIHRDTWRKMKNVADFRNMLTHLQWWRL